MAVVHIGAYGDNARDEGRTTGKMLKGGHAVMESRTEYLAMLGVYRSEGHIRGELEVHNCLHRRLYAMERKRFPTKIAFGLFEALQM